MFQVFQVTVGIHPLKVIVAETRRGRKPFDFIWPRKDRASSQDVDKSLARFAPASVRFTPYGIPHIDSIYDVYSQL